MSVLAKSLKGQEGNRKKPPVAPADTTTNDSLKNAAGSYCWNEKKRSVEPVLNSTTEMAEGGGPVRNRRKSQQRQNGDLPAYPTTKNLY